MRIIQILESASVGGMGTGSVATAPSKAGKMIRRQKPTDNALDSGKLFQETNTAEGKDDKIAQLKKDHDTAVHWSKNETSPQKREAARQKAEKIKAHLEKQYKQGVAEGEQNVAEGSAHGYNVTRFYRKYRDQSKITRWLKKEAGLPKETKLYFDDADLVLGSDTIVPYALVDENLKFNDLLTALVKVTGGLSKEKVDGVYRSQGVAEVAPPGAKAERMVKHIKKGYAKDGKLTKTEKSKAYGAAWKAHNAGKVEEQSVEENKKGVRAVKHAVKPRNFVAKNAVQSGAGAHKDKKKAQKQGDTKHKNKEPAYESRLWAALDRRIIK
jgi:hypothetical protein